MKSLNRISKFSFWLIVYTVLVILWGAWVRISHSGDGCGDSWPLCQGALLPETLQSQKTWVEFVHRIMSGIYGILVIIFWIYARSLRDLAPRLYFWAKWSLFFTVTEALLGAKLVVFGLVAQNDSPWRLFSMALHLLNSMTLVFCLTKAYLRTCWIGSELPTVSNKPTISFEVTLVPLILIVLTGVIAALSNTLFPSHDFWQALRDDFSAESHYLIRLRILHPLAGLGLGILLVAYLWYLVEKKPLTFAAVSYQQKWYSETIKLVTSLVFVMIVGMLLLFFKNYAVL
ncbi:MAG: COX15/CtaA family protein, partial [Bdellovibrionaceae bacterium]|nr:COX15/CtaA family protein [Pseudobdellovibrionaceae bacterium]